MDHRTEQLIRSASIYLLAERLNGAGRDASILWRSPDTWGDLGEVLDAWIEEAAAGIAFAIVAAVSVVDFPAAIIDGAFPTEVRARLVERVNVRLGAFDLQGLSPVIASAGTIGSGARAVGGACLPLLASFARDREVLFKEAFPAWSALAGAAWPWLEFTPDRIGGRGDGMMCGPPPSARPRECGQGASAQIVFSMPPSTK